MSEFEQTVAAPFKKNIRKPEFTVMELVFFYTLDKKWMDKDEAKKFIETAARKGLLKRTESGNFALDESLAETTVPMGFRPGDAIFKASADPVVMLLEKIQLETKIEKKQLAIEMQEIVDHFDGNLFSEAAVLLLAKKYHVGSDEFQAELVQRIRE